MLDLSSFSFDPVTQKNLTSWLQGEYSESVKKEIYQALEQAPEKITDAFYKEIDFGTGGLRGKVGWGTNRMNEYTIRKATYGLAQYVLTFPPSQQKKKHRILIGYDSRTHSRFFAEQTAQVLAACNIEVLLFRHLRPTPLVSFGCRFQVCDAAIMITASHNPPDYNGYKVYWNDGAQVLPPHDIGIIDQVQKVQNPTSIPMSPLSSSLITEVEEEIDLAYLKTLFSLQTTPELNKTHGKKLHVVYTPLHGTGGTIVPRALKEWGFTQISLVKEQFEPDGSFPTVSYPNPEEKAALQLGIDLLEKLQGDLLIANDPDADRTGLVVMDHQKPYILSGNQILSLCAHHLLKELEQSNKLPQNGALIKTIVSTELFQKIAEHYHISCFNVLTGFKYIGEKIREWENPACPDPYQYIYGGEESYGYLSGSFCRDKDGANSATLICEAALAAKLQNKTLIDVLYDLYKAFGIFREGLASITFEEGKKGHEKITKIMDQLRKNPPKQFLGVRVKIIEDYLTRISENLETKEKKSLLLPQSDVLLFWLEDETKLVVRPSGTEPKAKIYGGIFQKYQKGPIEKEIAIADQKVANYLESFKKECLLLAK